MRVLVCGSRDWDDYQAVKVALRGYSKIAIDPFVIIEGGAEGADHQAAMVAYVWKCGHEQYKAEWDKHGKAAGHIRNQRMLDEGRPDVVLAFKNDFDWTFSRGGTEDMVRRAKRAGVPTYVVSRA